MPSVELGSSPLAGGQPATISYLRAGQGPTLLFLHGGWGYGVYPIDIDAFAPTHQVLVPSRSGYGRSSPLRTFPPQFHYRAAMETLALLDVLGIDDAVWWGHSDGAVIAAMAAIYAPRKVRAVVLEALHLSAVKARSRAFFQRMASAPDSFNDSLRATLASEHGEDRCVISCISTAKHGWIWPAVPVTRRATCTTDASGRYGLRCWSSTGARIRAPSRASWSRSSPPSPR